MISRAISDFLHKIAMLLPVKIARPIARLATKFFKS